MTFFIGKLLVMTDGSYSALSLKNHKEKQMVPIYNSLVVFEVEEGPKAELPTKKVILEFGRLFFIISEIGEIQGTQFFHVKNNSCLQDNEIAIKDRDEAWSPGPVLGIFEMFLHSR